MDPTQAEIENFTDMAKVASWAGMTDPTRDAWFAHLGVSGSGHIRIIGGMGQKEYADQIAKWQIKDEQGEMSQPTPAQVSQAGLVGRAIRIALGLQRTVEAQRQHDAEQSRIAMASGSNTSASNVAAVTGKTLVKMSQTVNEINESVVEVKSDNSFSEGYAAYVRVMKKMPDRDQDVTIEQYTGFCALLVSGAPPYVDMAIFGPHYYRMLRSQLLQGLRLGADNNLHKVSMKGPLTFSDWEACYGCFKTVSLMTGTLSLGALETYEKCISGYHKRYGAQFWHIIYQADVRARQELTESLRRKFQSEQASAKSAGSIHPWEPEAPWEHVWNQLPEQTRFWKDELEDSIFDVRTKQASLPPPPPPNGPSKRKGNDDDRPPSKLPKRQQTPKVHNLGEDGNLSTNRRGVPLCVPFQEGKCKGVDQWNRCSMTGEHAHQCAKCLAPDHGASECKANGVRSPLSVKGKGKGKRKW